MVDGRTVAGLHNRTDTSVEGGWRQVFHIVGILRRIGVSQFPQPTCSSSGLGRLSEVENLFEDGCHRRSMGNMSLTVGAEDKTKTVSCYANNLALSETKVKVSFET